MKKLLAVVAVAGFAAFGFGVAANAAVFVFKGEGGVWDVPTGNVVQNCGTVGQDLCTDDHSLGLAYAKEGVGFTAVAFANGDPTLLIQDIFAGAALADSGLGALSEFNRADDQTQFDSGEWLEFTFDREVSLTNIEFNAGNDTDCSTPGPEGSCGFFDLFIDGVFLANLVAVDLLTEAFIGAVFLFIPTTQGSGFAIGRFEATPMPAPNALILLLAGLAGLGLAARGGKKPSSLSPPHHERRPIAAKAEPF